MSYGAFLGVQEGSEGFEEDFVQNLVKVVQKVIKMKRRVDFNRPEKIFYGVPGHNQSIRVLARDHIYPLNQSV